MIFTRPFWAFYDIRGLEKYGFSYDVYKRIMFNQISEYFGSSFFSKYQYGFKKAQFKKYIRCAGGGGARGRLL